MTTLRRSFPAAETGFARRLSARYAYYVVIGWWLLETLGVSRLAGPLLDFAFTLLVFPPIVALLAWRRVRARGRRAVGVIDVLPAAYLLFAAASALLGDQLLLGRDRYLLGVYARYAVPVMMFWIVRLAHPGDREMAVTAKLAAVIIVLEVSTGVLSLSAANFLPEFWLGRENLIGFRATGTFRSSVVYSGTLLFALAFTARRALLAEEKRRWWWWALTIGALLGMCLSLSRASWIAGMFAVIVLAIGYWRVSSPVQRRVIWLPVIALLVIVPFVWRPLADRLLYSQTVLTRLIMARAAFAMFLERPWLGWGYGSYDLRDWMYMQPLPGFPLNRYLLASATSHNSFLTMLAETGIIGLALYILPFALLFAASARRLRGQAGGEGGLRSPQFASLLWMVIGGILIMGQFSDLRFFPIIQATLWISLALIANLLERAAPDQEPH